jgi:hypothetical protein
VHFCLSNVYWNFYVVLLVFLFYSIGQTLCSPCVPGKYQPNTGRDACIDCETGKYVAANGSIAETVCTSCDAGRCKGVGIQSCTLCAPGQYQTSTGSTECIDCPPGTYYDSEGAISCVVCAAGKAPHCMFKDLNSSLMCIFGLFRIFCICLLRTVQVYVNAICCCRYCRQPNRHH